MLNALQSLWGRWPVDVDYEESPSFVDGCRPVMERRRYLLVDFYR